MASADVVSTSNGAVYTSISNLTSSTAENLTSSLTSLSVKDVVLLPFRVMTRFDRFLFTTLPRFLIYSTGLNVLANRAVQLFQNGGADIAEMAEAAQAVDVAGTTWSQLIMDAFQASTNKSYWGMLHYVTSRWAFTCFILAGILNRVTVYASSRQRITLPWHMRLVLRSLPVLLFISQIHQLLQAVRCQTSPNFSLYRHGDNNLYTIYDWSTEGGALHTASSAALFWSTDEQACAALQMAKPTTGGRAKAGSFSLLWPTFLRLGLSHLVENLSCSLQQIPTMTEVGLSVFEHSLAFAEAESMIAHTLDKQIAKSAAAAATSTTTVTVSATTSSAEPSQTFLAASGTITAITDAMHALTGPHIFDRINVPIQVLLVALISCGNSLSVHVLAILGKKNQWRLINTGVWGLAYMAAFTWGLLADSEMVRVDHNGSKPISGLVHFPTVAIVGLLPHIIIILGIMVCGMIYLLALLLTAVSLGTNPTLRQPTSLKERICIAHDNLQAAIQLKTIRIRWYEDFYTALLRVGFAALSAAAEAVFLNEGRAVEMRQFTWLEEDRLDDLDTSRSMGQPSAHFQIVERYGLPESTSGENDVQTGNWKSGYEKERKLDKDSSSRSKDQFIYPNPRTDGIGALQRTTRFYLLLIFMRGIIFTISGWVAFGIGAFLDRIGITTRPNWLRRMVGSSLKKAADDGNRLQALDESKRFSEWTKQQGVSKERRKDDVDIELEIRDKIRSEGHQDLAGELDERMYQWWKGGGWYGNRDDSGDFIPPSVEVEEDATSVITTTTAASQASNDEGWESEPEGSRTPTQRHHTPTWSFSGVRQRITQTPESEPPLLDNATLARLLNPQDKESRAEARILSSHLSTTTGIMTRSRFRRQFENDNAKVLLAGRVPTSNLNRAPSQSQTQSSRHPLTSDEEAHVLEQLLITRRTQKARQDNNTATADSNSTMSGPPCVVCQSEPRTIIAWPCRCLTVCEDCRVNLAMNNFGNCVTCRRSVGGFVRLYVP